MREFTLQATKPRPVNDLKIGEFIRINGEICKVVDLFIRGGKQRYVLECSFMQGFEVDSDQLITSHRRGINARLGQVASQNTRK